MAHQALPTYWHDQQYDCAYTAPQYTVFHGNTGMRVRRETRLSQQQTIFLQTADTAPIGGTMQMLQPCCPYVYIVSTCSIPHDCKSSHSPCVDPFGGCQGTRNVGGARLMICRSTSCGAACACAVLQNRPLQRAAHHLSLFGHPDVMKLARMRLGPISVCRGDISSDPEKKSKSRAGCGVRR